ncbi:ABC transporter, ATP-binding protein [delta proteobacterium NaphS2]|nr:ABC transporter, ATP-binding protein [delta proteobacterium NaphS2]
MNVIEMDGLVREYGTGKGVRGVNLTVHEGECFALLGRNGCGKSTLTRLIMGLEDGYSGSLRILGYDVAGGSREYLGKIGCVMDKSIHWEDLSGWENAWFFAKTYQMPEDAMERRLKELFEMADMMERARDPVREYSYGMRRKLALIEAFCHNPLLLVMDEPTTGVDPRFTGRMAEMIRNRTADGLSTWVAGNDPDWISGINTRLAFMDSGKILAIGTEKGFIEELSPFQKVRVSLGRSVKIPSPPQGVVVSFDQSDKEITIIIEQELAFIPDIMEWIVTHGGEVSDLQVRGSTLREAFLLKTGEMLEQ